MRSASLPISAAQGWLSVGIRWRIAGCVIVRQRPGTAKGFVFLSLEDETGIVNSEVRRLYFSARFALIDKSARRERTNGRNSTGHLQISQRAHRSIALWREPKHSMVVGPHRVAGRFFSRVGIHGNFAASRA
jgi:hypothetical protein